MFLFLRLYLSLLQPPLVYQEPFNYTQIIQNCAQRNVDCICTYLRDCCYRSLSFRKFHYIIFFHVKIVGFFLRETFVLFVSAFVNINLRFYWSKFSERNVWVTIALLNFKNITIRPRLFILLITNDIIGCHLQMINFVGELKNHLVNKHKYSLPIKNTPIVRSLLQRMS